MTIVGMHSSTNANGEKITTLHVTDNFDGYYNNREAGRSCEGLKVDTIYVGTYDVSDLCVGCSINIFYDRAVNTAKGVYQPIKLIEVVD